MGFQRRRNCIGCLNRVIRALERVAARARASQQRQTAGEVHSIELA